MPIDANAVLANIAAIRGVSDYHREIILTVLLAGLAGVTLTPTSINQLLTDGAQLQRLSTRALLEIRAQLISEL